MSEFESRELTVTLRKDAIRDLAKGTLESVKRVMLAAGGIEGPYFYREFLGALLAVVHEEFHDG